MKVSASAFTLAVFIGLGTASPGFAQATARSNGQKDIKGTINVNLFAAATGDAAVYCQEGDKIAGKGSATVEYTSPNPLPNPPPPALEKELVFIDVAKQPLKGTSGQALAWKM